MKNYEDYTEAANLQIFGTETPEHVSYKYGYYGYNAGNVFGPVDSRSNLPNDFSKVWEKVTLNQEDVDAFRKKAMEASKLADNNYMFDHRKEYHFLTDGQYKTIKEEAYDHGDEFDSFYDAFDNYYQFYKKMSGF